MNYISAIKTFLNAPTIGSKCTCEQNRNRCVRKMWVGEHGNLCVDSASLLKCGKVQKQIEATKSIKL